MFRKTNKNLINKEGEQLSAATKKASPSVIALDVNMLGNIISDGVVDFDGKLDGNIKCKVLYVRQNAVINGEITADEVFVYGRVKGTVRARNVTLASTAHAEGVIMHEVITIEDGATVDCKLNKTNKPVVSDKADVYEEPSEIISPAKMMENLRLIASN